MADFINLGKGAWGIFNLKRFSLGAYNGSYSEHFFEGGGLFEK
jgi:hypothetical protein